MKRNKALLLSLFIVLTLIMHAKDNVKNFCNPLNLNYRFQIKEPSYREAADPTVVWFKDRYYLFASMSGGPFGRKSSRLLITASSRPAKLSIARMKDDSADCISTPYCGWVFCGQPSRRASGSTGITSPRTTMVPSGNGLDTWWWFCRW